MAGSWDFSFSGLKTSVLYHLRDNPGPVRGRRLADLCASFQEAVAETLVEKTLAAAWRFGAKDIVVGGGVAANSRLRGLMKARAEAAGIAARLPSRILCTDNAAMIAHVGAHLLRHRSVPRSGRADPALALRSWA
ncbi:MAG: hypothetical protein A2506_03830 [Elusimicrobia bacterium RIFOXYD12_FULL_66_9]|nr:MAG: hypothetical protein A2506_03830 [Elusimicrobia bacterium RIFOXYD12_FULL_66_9]